MHRYREGPTCMPIRSHSDIRVASARSSAAPRQSSTCLRALTRSCSTTGCSPTASPRQCSPTTSPRSADPHTASTGCTCSGALTEWMEWSGPRGRRLLLTAMAQHWIALEPGDLGVFSLEEYDVPSPGPGEVTIEVRAAGMNPADYKHVAMGDPSSFPKAVGYEVAGVISAVGPGTHIASGGGRLGEEVLACRVAGGWASELTVPAVDVFAKPPGLSFAEAANLLLAGWTAAGRVHGNDGGEGGRGLVHGASGAVGVSVLQQAAARGIQVIGTASETSFDRVRGYAGVPVRYGAGL